VLRVARVCFIHKSEGGTKKQRRIKKTLISSWIMWLLFVFKMNSIWWKEIETDHKHSLSANNESVLFNYLFNNPSDRPSQDNLICPIFNLSYFIAITRHRIVKSLKHPQKHRHRLIMFCCCIKRCFVAYYQTIQWVRAGRNHQWWKDEYMMMNPNFSFKICFFSLCSLDTRKRIAKGTRDSAAYYSS